MSELISIEEGLEPSDPLTVRPIFHPGACIRRMVSPAFHPCFAVTASGLVLLISMSVEVPDGDSADVPHSPSVASVVSS